ncbi:MAG: aromatic ring-hydroxylating dioxygenase subunit alpha [Nocardioidaceae bacterium]|nr:MAG: aromatic ring-hydroxylating dioxygenase subunit alpha [Nocardioidaceae bacterium]
MTAIQDPPEIQESSHRWSERYPELGKEPLSVEPLVNEKYYELEKERMWRKVWLNVGTVHHCPKPGDYFVQPIKACNAEVLVMHGKDGKVRAFHNVCTHRGNKLIWDDRGSTKNYVSCSFHGWAFDLEGKLKSVLDEGSFYDIDRSCLGLTELKTQVWRGFIFVTFNPDVEPLEDYLGPLVAEMEDRNFEGLHLNFRYEIREDTNWKIAADAQNEMYHVPVLGPVHSGIGFLYTHTPNGLAKTTVFERFGKHTLWGTGFNPEYVDKGLNAVLIPKAPLGDGGMPKRGGVFDYYHLFPNTVIAMLGDVTLVYNFWPEAVDHTVWKIDAYSPKPKTAADLLMAHFWRGKLRDIISEDIAGHEAQHVGLASRFRPTFVVQDEEIAIRAFHKTMYTYVDPKEVEA